MFKVALIAVLILALVLAATCAVLNYEIAFKYKVKFEKERSKNLRLQETARFGAIAITLSEGQVVGFATSDTLYEVARTPSNGILISKFRLIGGKQYDILDWSVNEFEGSMRELLVWMSSVAPAKKWGISKEPKLNDNLSI